MILREPPNLIDGLPNLRPFDVSFIPGHSASNNVWKTPLSHIGFDVTVISPALEPRRLPPSLAARTKYILRLREGEWLKFQPDVATDADTRITRSGDDIIQDINTKNMALIPIPILPGGSTHGLFRRFLYGTDATPLHASDFDTNRPQAAIAAATARSPKVPSGILNRANDIWRHSKAEHQSSQYARFSPLEKFEKKFGLTVATAFSNHIARAHKTLTTMAHTQYANAPPRDNPASSVDDSMETDTVTAPNLDKSIATDVETETVTDDDDPCASHGVFVHSVPHS